MIPEGPDERIRARQRSRAIVMAVALGLFVILMFAVTIAKMTVNR
jgi:hypothetical protein